MERELRKWMYAVRKEEEVKANQFKKKKSNSIDDAFSMIGFHIYEAKKALCDK